MKTTIAALLVLATACASAPAPTATPAAPPARSLYDRLGGQPVIVAVVHKFVDTVRADDRIGGRFVNADPVRTRQLLVELLCQTSGGPCRYTGRPMREAHAGLHIAADEFDALVGDMAQTLRAFHVGEAEQRELLGALGAMKGDIVGR